MIEHLQRIHDAGGQLVLLKPQSKTPCRVGHMTHHPSMGEVRRHLETGGAFGVRPESLSCVVLDCDEGDGPNVAETWAGEAHFVTTPSSSSAEKPWKGHCWIRHQGTHVGNWLFRVGDREERKIASGEFRTTVHVALTEQAAEMLADAIDFGALDGPAMPTDGFRALRSSTASDVVDPDFNAQEGRELTETALPEDVARRLADRDRPARYEELFAIAARLKGERYSFDSVLEVIAPYVRAWAPQDGKFDGSEMRRHLSEAWRKLPAASDPANDFEDDLGAEPVPSAPKADEQPRFLDFFGLSQMKDPEWLVRGMIPVGSLGTILGESQTYKTFFALRIGLALSVGADPFEGHGPDERLPTQLFFIAGEGAETLKDRVTAALADLNVAPCPDGSSGGWEGSPPICFQPMPTAMNDEKEFVKLLRAMRAAREPDHRVIVFVDTLSQNFSGDENSTSDMRGFVRNLDRLKRALRAPVGDGREEDATVVFIHHLGKDKSKGARGSSLLLADVDFQITLSRSKTPLASEVTVTKQKAAAIGPVGTLQMRQTDGMGMEATLVCSAVLSAPGPDRSAATDRQAWIAEAYEPGVRRTELSEMVFEEFGVSQRTSERDVDKFVRDHRELSVSTGANNSKIIEGDLLPEGL